MMRGGKMVREKEKVRKCPLCGGIMSDGYSALPFLVGEKIAVIKDVPVEICSDCG
jgi:YgiT-type zinc finger domain-containing protein